MVIFTNNIHLTFDGWERFETRASKHVGLIEHCFNQKNIDFVSSKTNVKLEMTLVETQFDGEFKEVPVYWLYHAYSREKDRNITLRIFNS